MVGVVKFILDSLTLAAQLIKTGRTEAEERYDWLLVA